MTEEIKAERRAEAARDDMVGGTTGMEVARQLIRRTLQFTRRKFPAEEKIRIVLKGIRGEVAVSELCRREGIHPTIYYKWLKDFMEAGKGRIRGDTKREATSEEVRQLREGGRTLGLRVQPKLLGRNTCRATKDAVEGLDAPKPGSSRHAIRGQVGFKKQPLGPLQSALRDLRIDRVTQDTREPPLERSSGDAGLLDDIRNTDGFPGVILDKS